MARSAKTQGSFEIQRDSSTEVKRLFDQSAAITEYEQSVREIAASQTDEEINLGGVTTAKWLFIKADSEVTVKLNDVTNTGFTLSGTMFLKGEVTGIWITTSTVKVNVEILAAE